MAMGDNRWDRSGDNQRGSLPSRQRTLPRSSPPIRCSARHQMVPEKGGFQPLSWAMRRWDRSGRAEGVWGWQLQQHGSRQACLCGTGWRKSAIPGHTMPAAVTVYHLRCIAKLLILLRFCCINEGRGSRRGSVYDRCPWPNML